MKEFFAVLSVILGLGGGATLIGVTLVNVECLNCSVTQEVQEEQPPQRIEGGARPSHQADTVTPEPATRTTGQLATESVNAAVLSSCRLLARSQGADERQIDISKPNCGLPKHQSENIDDRLAEIHNRSRANATHANRAVCDDIPTSISAGITRLYCANCRAAINSFPDENLRLPSRCNE